MKYRVITEPQAEAQMADVFHWVAKDSPHHAMKFIEGMEKAINSLQGFPSRCGIAPESEFFGVEIRQLLYGNYRILFTIEGMNVRILHVRHGARQPLKPDEN